MATVSLVRTFDQRYQITRIQAGTLDLQYTRDAAGRVIGVSGNLEPEFTPGTGTTMINNANNQASTVGGAAFRHDANGNLTSDGAFTYTWDALNRLIQVEQNGAVVANYSYDSQNRRISKTVGEQTIHYLYDLNNQLIAETLADGTPIRDFFYYPDNQPLAVREYQANPGLYFFINDHLGTPQQLISSTGTVVWQAAYLPYGEVKVQVNTVTNNLRFPGQYFDAETGLHYNWNRYYDPVTGRYISPDPIGLEGGLNLYAYVGGNPVNWSDPQGLNTEIIIWQPVGWKSSSFGHVSSNVNGTNYSWTPSGWDTTYPNVADYIKRQQEFRSGVGTILNLTSEQERKLVECYAKQRKDYDKFTNNCGDPHKQCLEEATGIPFSDSFFPVNIGNDSLDSPYYGGSKFYDGPSAPRGFFDDGPWVR